MGDISRIWSEIRDIKNEQVLVVNKRSDSLVVDSLSRDSHLITTTRFNLGFFEYASFDENTIIFHMPFYTVKENFIGNWERIGGDMMFGSSMNSIMFGEDISLHIGKDVEAFFRDIHNLYPNPLDIDTVSNTKVPDYSYIRALHFLGLRGPEDLEDGYKGICLDSSQAVYSSISKLEFHLKGLRHRMNSLEKSILKGDIPHLGNSKADVFFCNYGDEENIKEILSRISCSIMGAIKKGLHEYDLTFSPKRGVEVDVREYILGLCETYKIEIPEKFCIPKKDK